MKKTTYKRISGLFILAFAFFVIGMPQVFAQTCEDYKKGRADEKTRYIPKFDYNVTNDVATVYIDPDTFSGVSKINPSKIKFKLTNIYGVNDSSETNLSISAYSPSSLTLYATKNDAAKIKLYNLKSVFSNYDSIKLRFVPDGYTDPDYEKGGPGYDACCTGNSSQCGITEVFVSYSVDYTGSGEKIEIHKINDGDLKIPAPGGNGTLDCNNYASKFTNGSFEYEFCKAKTLAPKENVYDFTDTNNKTGKGFLTFAEKTNNAIKVFKCDKNQYVENTVGTPEYLTNYYTEKNTKYLYGSSNVIVKTGYYYVYNHSWKKSKSEELTCNLKCEEAVSVEYGPPIASAAGLCFGYKVRVTSRVVCNQDGDIKKPNLEYKVCTPYPYCKSSDGSVSEEGGPNDDFDDCVNACDKGKYTDKCVNQCYNRIYGKTETTKMVAKQALENTSTAQLRKVEKGTCEYDGKGYQIVNGAIVWDTGSAGENRKYCFNKNPNNDSSVLLPKCYDTAVDFPYDPRYFKDTENNTGKCTRVENGKQVQRWYNAYDKVTGIPKRTTSSTCNDTCSWKGCTGDDIYLNDTEAKEDMKHNIDAYNYAIAACSAKSSCSTTESQYVISVNYSTVGSGEQTIYFPYVKGNNNNNSKKTKDTIQYSKDDGYASCPREKDNKVIINQSGSCYKCQNDCNKEQCGDNCAKDCDKHWYQAEWTFAGTWFDRKHREVITYDKESIQNPILYSFLPQHFCLPQGLKSVNSDWYYLYQLHILKLDKYAGVSANEDVANCPTELEKIRHATEDVKIDKYNIKASTRKFGKFEWDIDMECFYGTPSASICKPPENNTKSTANYKIRTVDLKNLFPNKDGKKSADSVVGLNSTTVTSFNWSKYANQTIKDPEYTSQPLKYKNWVEANNYMIYDGDKYLDYEIYLTKESIAKIKKTDVNYDEWDGSVINTGANRSRDIYRSGLLRDEFKCSNNAGATNKCPGTSVLKCNNIRNYEAKACEEF